MLHAFHDGSRIVSILPLHVAITIDVVVVVNCSTSAIWVRVVLIHCPIFFIEELLSWIGYQSIIDGLLLLYSTTSCCPVSRRRITHWCCSSRGPVAVVVIILECLCPQSVLLFLHQPRDQLLILIVLS